MEQDILELKNRDSHTIYQMDNVIGTLSQNFSVIWIK